MRLVLLASIAWVVTLTEPLFHIFDHPFSGRDLILLFGGVFLLFKGTMELHERMEGNNFIKKIILFMLHFGWSLFRLLCLMRYSH